MDWLEGKKVLCSDTIVDRLSHLGCSLNSDPLQNGTLAIKSRNVTRQARSGSTGLPYYRGGLIWGNIYSSCAIGSSI